MQKFKMQFVMIKRALLNKMVEKLIFKDVNFSIKDKLEIVLIKGLNQGIYGYHVYMKKGSQKS